MAVARNMSGRKSKRTYTKNCATALRQAAQSDGALSCTTANASRPRGGVPGKKVSKDTRRTAESLAKLKSALRAYAINGVSADQASRDVMPDVTLNDIKRYGKVIRELAVDLRENAIQLVQWKTKNGAQTWRIFDEDTEALLAHCANKHFLCGFPMYKSDVGYLAAKVALRLNIKDADGNAVVCGRHWVEEFLNRSKARGLDLRAYKSSALAAERAKAATPSRLAILFSICSTSPRACSSACSLRILTCAVTSHGRRSRPSLSTTTTRR